MRYRVNDYTIDEQNNIVLPISGVTIEDIRLIVNETQKKVICSSMQKSNVGVNGNLIEVPIDICMLRSGDQLTIEIDRGDNIYDIIDQIDDDISLQLKQILGYD